MAKKEYRKEATEKGLKVIREINTLNDDELGEIKQIYALISLTVYDEEELKEKEEMINMDLLNKMKINGMETYYDLKYRIKYGKSRHWENKKIKEKAKEEGKEEIVKFLIQDGRYSIEEIAKISQLEEKAINQLLI